MTVRSAAIVLAVDGERPCVPASKPVTDCTRIVRIRLRKRGPNSRSASLRRRSVMAPSTLSCAVSVYLPPCLADFHLAFKAGEIELVLDQRIELGSGAGRARRRPAIVKIEAVTPPKVMSSAMAVCASAVRYRDVRRRRQRCGAAAAGGTKALVSSRRSRMRPPRRPCRSFSDCPRLPARSAVTLLGDDQHWGRSWRRSSDSV